MDIKSNWKEIKKHFNKSFRTNFYVSIASVDKDNNPTVTPIGSLFLNNNQTGYYFEKYPTKLAINSQNNPNVCILAVNSNAWFWLKSLFIGEFKNCPAIKLYGKLGAKRKASDIEKRRLYSRMKSTNGFKGNTYLWGKMDDVRDISFLKAEKINLGKMTKKL
jgi:uncharacterized protein